MNKDNNLEISTTKAVEQYKQLYTGTQRYNDIHELMGLAYLVANASCCHVSCEECPFNIDGIGVCVSIFMRNKLGLRTKEGQENE